MITIAYRTDWIAQDDPHRNRVDLSLHGGDLKAAKAMARKMSKLTGSAYVIRSADGVDVAHLPHTDGRQDGGWDS